MYQAMNVPASNRPLVRNTCAQCGESLIAASWSEHLSERRIRHVWECDSCGYEFETTVYLSADEAMAA